MRLSGDAGLLPAVDSKTTGNTGIKIHLLPQMEADKGEWEVPTTDSVGALCVESRTGSSLLVFQNSRFGECKHVLGGYSE
jgi:hypothetical protein